MTHIPEGALPVALRCSFAAEQRGDPLAGTAAPASGFFLIEQPGPWGRLALVESRLSRSVGFAVSARAVAAGMRALLIRRPGRTTDSTRRRWAVVDSTAGSESIVWGEFEDDAELLDVPLDGGAGLPSSAPCFLVCTHGRHDACCAIRGRPIAEALARNYPDAVWECSHIGGDRFAANLIALPHGLYYGRVDERAAREIALAHQQGLVAIPWLRGRTTLTPPAQAAQQLARVQLGELSINALNPVAVRALGDARWEVRLAGVPDLLVTLGTTADGPTAYLTCAATHAAHPPAYRVEDIQRIG